MLQKFANTFASLQTVWKLLQAFAAFILFYFILHSCASSISDVTFASTLDKIVE